MEQEHQEEEVAVVEEIELPVNCQNKENKEIKEEVEGETLLHFRDYCSQILAWLRIIPLN